MAVPDGARVSLFLGKGGVGKTTVSAAFAIDRAAAGERVLLMSLTNAADLRARLVAEGGPTIPPTLELATIDPRALVDDAVRAITRLGALGVLITRHPGYASLVDIAPGVKELAVLNRVWTVRRQGYDRVVVDGPATGHGLHFLEAPSKMAELLVGRLRERALAVRDMLRDARATEVVVVTLPEEMPVRETTELAAVLRREAFPLDNVVVNKWFPDVFEDAGAGRVLDRLQRDPAARRELARGIARDTRIDVDAWLAAASLIRAERTEALDHLAALRKLDVKLAVVPHVPAPDGRLARVAAALARASTAGVIA